MSDSTIHPDDPRLTAYALGELSPTEQAEIERLLANAPDCRAAVEEIRGLAGQLTAELQSEPATALSAAQRAAIVGAAGFQAATSVVAPSQGIRWTRHLAAIVTVAAMGAVAVLILPATRPGVLTGRTAGDSRHEEELALREENPNRIGIDHGFIVVSDGALRSNDRPAQEFEFIPGEPGNKKLDKDLAAVRAGILTGGSGTENLSGPRSTSSTAPADGSDRNESGAARAGKEGSAVSRVGGGGYGTQEERLKYGDGRPTGDSTSPAVPGLQQSGKPANGKHFVTTANAPRQQAGGSSESGGAKGTKADGGETTTPRSVVLTEKQAQLAQGVRSPVPENRPLQPEGEVEQRKSGRDVRYKMPVASKGLSVASAAPEGKPADKLEDLTSKRVSKFYYDPYGVAVRTGESFRLRDGAEVVAEREKKLLKDLKEVEVVLERAGRVEELERYRRETEIQRGRRLQSSATPGTEQYEPINENPFVYPREQPLSTFGVDVDTASYTNMRRFLNQGQWPPANAVRVEELVNYFSYDYPQPGPERPFSVNVESGQCPWQAEHRIVRIGLKGKEIARDKRPASNLVFLVDVSGSMSDQKKLPLVKTGLNLLAEQMTESDRVAIVTYSDTAAVRLESTTGDKQQAIREVINGLHAGGSTNGAAGIQMAYDMAVRHFIDNGTNRVILCTDGDFNVGVTGDDELVKMIQERARTKVYFSVFGFGMGNLKDGKLEKLADKGNGHYAYVDDENEIRKVFVEELAGTLITIAKDVKIQVEFNPGIVGAYRLIGYENRALAAQDFADDKKDAGEIGAGHSVTALYEIVPAERTVAAAPRGEKLRYQAVLVPKDGEAAAELLTVRLRYKQPDSGTGGSVAVLPLSKLDPESTSILYEMHVTDTNQNASRPSPDFNWAAAVAGFAMVLRGSDYRGQAGLDMILELAQGAKGEDKTGRRQEFINLVQRAKSLRPEMATAIHRSESATPVPPVADPAPLTREQAQQKASVNGKYRNLLRVFEAESDVQSYGSFRDWGYYTGNNYRGHNNLPAGYWVYVAPHWYIWGDVNASPEEKKSR